SPSPSPLSRSRWARRRPAPNRLQRAPGRAHDCRFCPSVCQYIPYVSHMSPRAPAGRPAIAWLTRGAEGPTRPRGRTRRWAVVRADVQSEVTGGGQEDRRSAARSARPPGRLDGLGPREPRAPPPNRGRFRGAGCRMKPPAFEYVRAGTTEEAVAELARAGEDARLLAGGQSLMPILNMRLAMPRRLIDLNRVGELAYIRERED